MTPRYYYKINDKFIVKRRVNDKYIVITCYNEKQAQECVRLLNECGWDKKQAPIIREKLGLL